MLSQYNDYRRVLSPATAKNIITVGGTQPFPDHENRLFFSAGDGSRPGLTNDARIKPTVMLPGIVRNARQRPYSTCETANRYGTSFAAPAVAGIAALVREFLSNEYGMLSPSAALTKAIIINSARNMTGLDTLGPIPSPGQGWGRVTLHDTLRMPGNAGLQLIDHSSGLPTDQSLTYQFEVTNPALWDYLKITLVWTDYPGNPAAALAIVNDLDLTVIAPDGTVYLGNVFHQGYSVVGGIPDRRNVEEQVFLPKHIIPIQEGVYRVIVHAYNVPEGPQPFALVINLHPGAGAFLPLMFNSYNLSGNMIFPPTPESGYPGPGQPESPYP
ncbi:MAG: S8 family serine peptidase [Anaerolineae bacterium]|nr:S8 family serine peptidase [Anaerolineae bacterium]